MPMSLKVVGAGLGRTGTHSLKVALEELLGQPCYHMVEVFQRPADVPVWKAAALDQPVDWGSMFQGYAAAVDWPASSFWPEISAHYPDAKIVYSRRDPEAWWESASNTIFAHIGTPADEGRAAWFDMVSTMFERRFTTQLKNREACLTAFRKHETSVLDSAPRDRLVIWQASDGWGPLCSALDLPEPKAPFPLTNTREQFLARLQADPPPKPAGVES